MCLKSLQRNEAERVELEIQSCKDKNKNQKLQSFATASELETSTTAGGWVDDGINEMQKK